MQTILQKTYLWLFVGNIAFEDHNAYRKLLLVNVLLLITSVTLLSFALLSALSFDNALIASIDFLAGFLALYAYLDLRFSQNIDKSINIGVATLFIFFLGLAYTQHNNDFILIWTIFFPIFVMTLKGHKEGIIITLVFYSILFFVVYQGIGSWQNGAWNFQSFIRFAIASLILTYIIYVKESALNQLIQKEHSALNELKRLSITDSLTGLFNRRYINKKLELEINLAIQNTTPLSLAILDIDNFKEINDQYGHNHGDYVLQEVSDLLRLHLPQEELLARWGGEEFLIIFPNQSIETAMQLCNEIREKIIHHRCDTPINITASFGVAEYKIGNEHNAFIARADNALYQAKKSGRNQVCRYDEVPHNQTRLFDEQPN
ncbi:GGDEF domain-containing protein [Thiomicrorhabdus arctica]|uniref:GGDEF domain-containing protein n=1 Tax=Thiomicrorhabdus arctica TaxID=131540 RepID=UPI00036AF415|nr:GGDEF domain-containing protein [Thiomicrorhabdus arctica]